MDLGDLHCIRGRVVAEDAHYQAGGDAKCALGGEDGRSVASYHCWEGDAAGSMGLRIEEELDVCVATCQMLASQDGSSVP
jgi:hypothetical protein